MNTPDIPLFEVFEQIAGDPSKNNDMNGVYRVIQYMLRDATMQERGRWRWRGFWLDNWEFEALTHQIIRAYVVGVAWPD